MTQSGTAGAAVTAGQTADRNFTAGLDMTTEPGSERVSGLFRRADVQGEGASTPPDALDPDAMRTSLEALVHEVMVVARAPQFPSKTGRVHHFLH